MPTPCFSYLPFILNAASPEKAVFSSNAEDALSVLTPNGLFLTSKSTYLIYYCADAEDTRASVSLFLNNREIAATRSYGQKLCGGAYTYITDTVERAQLRLVLNCPIFCNAYGFLIIAKISP